MFAVQHQVKYVCNVSRSTSYKLVNKRVHTDKLYKRQLCTEQEAQTATSSSHTEFFFNGVFSTLWLPTYQVDINTSFVTSTTARAAYSSVHHKRNIRKQFHLSQCEV